uniref:Uncharacterized protein n=1 Tax=Oncorhynchus mykiss TaxID=8022 RepID=A0A8C7S9A3_ONCMY
DLPSSFQQRLSYTTLSDLALRLIDGTHLNLYNQRQNLHCEHQVLKQDLIRKHKETLQVCKSHCRHHCLYQALEIQVREEQMMDDKILVEMDQKVINQQNTRVLSNHQSPVESTLCKCTF